METWVGLFLGSLVVGSPVLVVDLVGIVLALVRWRRHPRVSQFALLAYGLFLVAWVGGSFLFAWLPDHLEPREGMFERRLTIMTVIGLIRNVFAVIPATLLMTAVFIDRSSTNRLQGLPTGVTDPVTRERWEADRSEHVVPADRPPDDDTTEVRPPSA
jgi:hypothetical protein